MGGGADKSGPGCVTRKSSNATPSGPFTGAGQGRQQDIYAARLDAAGNVIDTTPIVVARGLLDQRYPQVEWNGQNWLVAWLSTREDDSYSFDDTYSVEIRAARVAPDGTVLDQTPIVVRASTTNSEIWPREVVFDGTNWIVVWLGTADAAPSVRSVFAARVTGAGAVLDAGEGKEIYRHNSASLDDPDLAFGGDGFLLTFAATTTAFSASNAVRAVRLSPALDQIGAPFRVNVGSALGFSEPRVASDGANYFVVWDGSAINNTAGPDRVYGSRVSSAGAVLDPDGIVIARRARRARRPTSAGTALDTSSHTTATSTRPRRPIATRTFTPSACRRRVRCSTRHPSSSRSPPARRPRARSRPARRAAWKSSGTTCCKA